MLASATTKKRTARAVRFHLMKNDFSLHWQALHLTKGEVARLCRSFVSRRDTQFQPYVETMNIPVESMPTSTRSAPRALQEIARKEPPRRKIFVQGKAAARRRTAGTSSKANAAMVEKIRRSYFVPKMRSPASPNPGTM